MSELRSLVDAARTLRTSGESYLVATVVDVHGSSYRRPGARMVFTAERWLAGSVSGGCLERDVVAKGPWRTRDGRAQLVTYDGATDERSGSGCEGIIDVLVERSDGQTLRCPVRFAERCLEDETRGVLFTVFRSTRDDAPVGARYALLASGEQHTDLTSSSLRDTLQARGRCLLDDSASAARAEAIHVEGVDLLMELVVPPLHLFIFGSAHDALPVVTLGKALGWSVTVHEPTAQLSTRERFRPADHHLTGPLTLAMQALSRCARPMAVIMAHHYERDLEALLALADSRAPYIGLLGSRKRSARLLDDLAASGRVLDQSMRARIHAPVGLALGAESPQEIALSIIAEVQACATAPMSVDALRERGHVDASRDALHDAVTSPERELRLLRAGGA